MQHGCRSIITAVEMLVGTLHQTFVPKNSAQLPLSDLSKAFDCVSHKVFLEKAARYGPNGAVRSILKSYLSGRQHLVSVHGTVSKVAEVQHDVPQGPLFRPLLFFIMINDFNINSIDLSCLLYPNDTTVIKKCNNIDDLLVRAANDLEETKN